MVFDTKAKNTQHENKIAFFIATSDKIECRKLTKMLSIEASNNVNDEGLNVAADFDVKRCKERSVMITKLSGV